MRSAGTATLATVMAGAPESWPYASLVQVALAVDASPLLLISDLAAHGRNIAADPRVSLLFDGTAGLAERLAGPRVSVLGRVRRCDPADGRGPALLERFLSYHPGAGRYAGFADFHLYRLSVDRAHLVSGFGEIHWVPGADVRLSEPRCAALATIEARIVAHMNRDHDAALNRIAERLLEAEGNRAVGTGWRLAGLDPEGFDLRSGGVAIRGRFALPVLDAADAREAFVALARAARQ